VAARSFTFFCCADGCCQEVVCRFQIRRGDVNGLGVNGHMVWRILRMFKSVELIHRLSLRLSPILISGLLASGIGCGKKEEAKSEARPAEVFVVKIEPQDTPIDFEYVAQTQSSHEVQIRARVNGFLDRRVYTEGTVV